MKARDEYNREIRRQRALLNDLLLEYENSTKEEKKRRLLAGAAVVGAYIKRYGNLFLTGKQVPVLESCDLSRCFEESFRSLSLLKVTCLQTLPSGEFFAAGDLLRAYRCFEMAVEACLFDLVCVWIHVRENGETAFLLMDFACDTDLSTCRAEADGFSFEDGTYRLMVRLQRGERQMHLPEHASQDTGQIDLLQMKSRLHDRMNLSLAAIRQILQKDEVTSEDSAVLRRFCHAVSLPEKVPQKEDLSELFQDAALCGMEIRITGELPKEEELLQPVLLVLREAMVNAARHANASVLYVEIIRREGMVELHVTNDGKLPETDMMPQGGLLDLQRRITAAGGVLKLKSRPVFELTAALPEGVES